MKTEDTVYHVQAFFVHTRMLRQRLSVLDAQAMDAWANSFPTDMERKGAANAHSERIVAELYGNSPDELAIWLMDEPTVGDTRLITVSQQFYFRKINDRRKGFRASFRVNTNIELEGEFATEGCVGDTGLDFLSGNRRVTMLGIAEVLQTGSIRKVRIAPWFIGHMVARPASEGAPMFDYTDHREVWPREIDQFSLISECDPPTPGMLKEVKSMPEETVKNHFAEIISEPYVGKDWGGESSDLYTNRLTISGKNIRAGFAFKGPGLPGKLTISGMGKNGDQGLRLYQQPIDIGIIQHHREIDAQVRNLMEAVARHYRAKYMIIDGSTTAQILNAYGYLKTAP
ncbi:hypothetical protein [Arthrobacter sp. zg-Y750]|uniref:hypothetical protein n=1 Tax=Arthrobacter sp. zg-Y750 TaxID=2894189 RepID=UPI001E2FC55B|nr:hypothetical protein [Arthrobacter sp. zg-Y750]MCC9176784.1 hypothetical protein [Arthrobacter sp. zg-Y750]